MDFLIELMIPFLDVQMSFTPGDMLDQVVTIIVRVKIIPERCAAFPRQYGQIEFWKNCRPTCLKITHQSNLITSAEIFLNFTCLSTGRKPGQKRKQSITGWTSQDLEFFRVIEKTYWFYNASDVVIANFEIPSQGSAWILVKFGVDSMYQLKIPEKRQKPQIFLNYFMKNRDFGQIPL
ncbi:Uncharacterized protein APZ42_006904 [Daphnia magna]|uniref:Uncharacterized protein n=1 Tax=Daphnia magna TaxID=35525 RepID=A0A164FMK8_9CRUS|nr:Uncharacterized protein APZ42_006904 [Daphnia magna]